MKHLQNAFDHFSTFPGSRRQIVASLPEHYQPTNMATRPSINAQLPPTAECLAILIGCAELSVFGVRGVTNPGGWLEGFGLPILRLPTVQNNEDVGPESDRKDSTSSNEVHNAQRALVEALAARNVQNGVLILTFACVLRDRRALGVAVFAGLITTVADTMVTWRYGASDAVAGHLVGVANCLGIGGALLFWRTESAV